eukprot:9138364-Alexandrium_andersonii.AAC.1
MRGKAPGILRPEAWATHLPLTDGTLPSGDPRTAVPAPQRHSVEFRTRCDAASECSRRPATTALRPATNCGNRPGHRLSPATLRRAPDCPSSIEHPGRSRSRRSSHGRPHVPPQS